MILRCITLWQPWASWIEWGWKSIETRGHDRFASLVGQRIGIHAGNHWDPNAFVEAGPWLTQAHRDRTWAMARRYRGMLLCTVQVADGKWLDGRDEQNRLALCETTGRWGMLLGNVQAVQPAVVVAGHQGIWNMEYVKETA